MGSIILRSQKGVNCTTAALLLPEGEYSYLQNVRSRPIQNLAKRQGIEFVSSNASAITGIFDVSLDDVVYPVISRPGVLVFNPVVNTSSTGSLPNPYGILGENQNGQSNTSLDPGAVLTIKARDSGGASSDCTYTPSTTTVSLDETAQNTTINVAAYIGCGWNAVPQDGWITSVSGSAHLAGGDYTFHVSANTGNARTGSIKIYKGSSGSSVVAATITVNQDGLHSVYTFTGPALQAMFNGVVCTGVSGPGAGTAWDGTLLQTSPTRWDSAPFNSWNGVVLGGSPQHAYASLIKDTPAPGDWAVGIGNTLGWSWGIYKVGASPVGAYTIDLGGCVPPNVLAGYSIA